MFLPNPDFSWNFILRVATHKTRHKGPHLRLPLTVACGWWVHGVCVQEDGEGEKMSKTAAFGFEWEGAGVSVLIGFLALLISVRAAGHYSEGCWPLF